MNVDEIAQADRVISTLTGNMQLALRQARRCDGALQVGSMFTDDSGTMRALRARGLVEGARTLTLLGEQVSEVLAERFRASFKDPRI